MGFSPTERTAMRDFKCVACKIRTRRAGDSADVVGDSCPVCGSALERVGELSEVVGFRSVKADGPVDNAAPVGDFTARRNALYAQRVSDALAAEGWMDDGGFAVASVALPASYNAGAPGEKGTT
jgi:hypothetical protein